MRLVFALCVLLSLASVEFSFAQQPPAIGIISPPHGGSVIGPDVAVQVEVTDFTLLPPTGTDANPGAGHIIYYLDVEPVFVPGQPAIPTDPAAVYAASEQLTHTFEDVAPGPHDVWALLVLDKHVPVIPPAIDTVNFTVTAPSETPQPAPSPSVTEIARSVATEEATSVPTETSTSAQTPAVLPAEMPPAGATPSESDDGSAVWPFVLAAAGIVAVTSGSALMMRMRRGRK